MSGSPVKLPAGFRPFPQNVGYANAIDPMFFCESEAGVTLGLEVRRQHLNGMGICHGGVIMLMADICCSWNVRNKLSERGASRTISPPTVSLNFDFLKAARSGDWLEASVDMLELKRSLGFAAGKVTRDSSVIARFSGSFHVAKHDGFDFDPEIARRYQNSLDTRSE